MNKLFDLKIKFACFFLFLIIAGCSEKGNNFSQKIEKDASAIKKAAPVIPADYIIGPSDALEILYYTDPSISDYIIDTEDKLQINFYYYRDLSKTVTVRPDGFITLAKIGDIKAAGELPRVLAKKISSKYSKQLLKPDVTVEVVEFNSKIKMLRDVVRNSYLGQLKYTVVRPDGKISLPYLRNDFIASGKTAPALSKELEKEYRKNINTINITVSVTEAKSYQACVVGDVQRAGCYMLSGTTTLLQLVSSAGGFTKEANLHQIVIISRNADGKPVYSVKNVDEIIHQGDVDSFVRQYDVVYVPRTWLSEAALTANAIWKLIPTQFGVNANVYQVPFN